MLPRHEVTRVRRWLRSGSSAPLVVETRAGTFVAKLRGAGHGVTAVVAEIIVAALAVRLGLPVPEAVLLELGPETPSDDANDELADLLVRSVGTNLGVRFLPGARVPRAEELARLDDDFVARALWLDGLTMNPDRTPQNPNLLFWHGRPWLIDHGAALPFHHAWAEVSEDTPREPTPFGGHLFEAKTGLLAAVDDALSERLGSEALAAAMQDVPDELLRDLGAFVDPERARVAYQAFLHKRLKPPRPFVTS